MVGIIYGFRWSFLGENMPLHFNGLIVSSVVTVILLITGLNHFRNVEDTFADEIWSGLCWYRPETYRAASCILTV